MSAIIIDARRQEWPVDWGALFCRQAPLAIEIGFGNGQFLVDLAHDRPAANVIGIDISLPSLRRAERRVLRAGLQYVRLLSCAADYALWALCPPESIDDVFINFPDPWPKAAHHHRRLISEHFLQLLASRMRRGGLLDVATDHEEYAHWIEEALQRSAHFVSREATPYVTEDAQRRRTKYEQIALDAGRTCYYFRWQRNFEPTPLTFPIPKEYAMPHVVFRSPLEIEDIAERFVPLSWQGDGAQGRFLDVLRSGRSHNLLVDAYISEEPMSQRVAFVLRPRRGQANELILGLHELGFPRPTSGVHLALAAFMRWLTEVHADTEIVESNLQDSAVTVQNM